MTLRAKTILATIVLLIVGVLVAGGVYHRKAIGEWFKETFPSKQTVNTLKKENTEKDEKITSLQESVTNLGSEVSSLQSEKMNLTNQLTEVNAKLQTSTQANEQLTAEKESLEEKLNEVNEKLDKVYSKIDTIYTKNNLNVSDLSANQDEAIIQKLEAISTYIDDLKTQSYSFIDTKQYAVGVRGWAPFYLEANQIGFYTEQLYNRSAQDWLIFDLWKIYSTICDVNYDNLDLNSIYIYDLYNTSISDPLNMQLIDLKKLHIDSVEYTGDFEKIIIENEFTDFTFKVYANGEAYSSLSDLMLGNFDVVYFVYDEQNNTLQLLLFSIEHLATLDYAIVS